VWGGLTHAFPYEPGFVLCDRVGECNTSGELVSSSSGLLLYIVERGGSTVERRPRIPVATVYK